MAIDVHAHYVPPSLFPTLLKEGKALGIDLIETEPNCHCVHFHYGLKCRPFFTRLVESPQERMDAMDNTGIDRQILSGWVDVFGHGLTTPQGQAWHRLLNESMSSFCAAASSSKCHCTRLANADPSMRGTNAVRARERVQ